MVFTEQRPVKLQLSNEDLGDKIARMLDDTTLNQDQRIVCTEILEWLSSGSERMKVFCGYAGTGKSYCVQTIIRIAYSTGIFREEQSTYACAPTHQAAGILRSGLKSLSVGVSTVHSLLGISPQLVEFKREHASELNRLLSIPESDRTEDDDALIESLQVRQRKSFEEVKEFTSSLNQIIKRFDRGDVALILVDEAGMLAENIVDLLDELVLELRASGKRTKILLIGDPAQLPPIKEAYGKAFTYPQFTPLTKVVRYSGNILDYCTNVRIREDYLSCHKLIDQDLDETVFLMPEHEVMDGIIPEFRNGTPIRFIAATNNRVHELNTQIRSRLSPGNLNYVSDDYIITNNPIIHDKWPGIPYENSKDVPYLISCSGINAKSPSQALSCHTSTILQLQEKLVPGESVVFTAKATGGKERITLRPQDFTHASGVHVFKRNLFKYKIVGAQSDADAYNYISLIDFEQSIAYEQELDRLRSLAKSAYSTSKKRDARGQQGDAAKLAWSELGLKNWETYLDGSGISIEQFEQIRRDLWSRYYTLRGFADSASYSYATTCHRAQGSTIDLVILDTETLMRQSSRQDECWDTRKLLYTAASRASKQLILMTRF
jgi:type II secretory pathway predicted ATPase ExeA